jgi:hypothetical protein
LEQCVDLCTGIFIDDAVVEDQFYIGEAEDAGRPEAGLLLNRWVMISISVLVTSGKASMGIFLKVMIPVMSRRTAQNKIKYLFLRENPIIFLRNLFITGRF